MKTYKIDRKECTLVELEYDKRNNTSIWINGKRRDTTVSSGRFEYIDDLELAHQALVDVLDDKQAVESHALVQKYRVRREALARTVAEFSTMRNQL